MAFLLALGAVGEVSAAEIRDLSLVRSGEGFEVSFRLAGDLPPEIEARLRSGVEVSFEFTVALKRRRSGLPDKTVSERYVTAFARLKTVTRMYQVSRSLDGTVVDLDETDDRATVNRWLTAFDRLKLFDGRDLDGPGLYYVRVRAKLLASVKALVIPWGLDTSWAETERVRVEEAP